MGKGNCFHDLQITVDGNFGMYKRPDQIKQWISAAGGKYSPKLQDSTTHLIVSEDHWKRKVVLVREALDRDDLKILTFDWLEDCLSKGRKLATKKYEWTTIDKTALKKAAKKGKQASSETTDKQTYGEALLEHTKQYAAPSELNADESVSYGAKTTARAKNKSAKKDFARGNKVAKTVSLSNNQHTYQDATGFKYEVTVTRVEARQNWNERVTIILYETNTLPHTYACSVKTEGTWLEADSTLLSALGSNYATAFRMFKNEFKKRTTIAWDERFTFCKPRTAARKPEGAPRNSGFIDQHDIIKAGGSREPSRIPVDDAAFKNFQAKPFIYRTPSVGEPQGLVAAGKTPIPASVVVVNIGNDEKTELQAQAGARSHDEAAKSPARRRKSKHRSMAAPLEHADRLSGGISPSLDAPQEPAQYAPGTSAFAEPDSSPHPSEFADVNRGQGSGFVDEEMDVDHHEKDLADVDMKNVDTDSPDVYDSVSTQQNPSGTFTHQPVGLDANYAMSDDELLRQFDDLIPPDTDDIFYDASSLDATEPCSDSFGSSQTMLDNGEFNEHLTNQLGGNDKEHLLGAGTLEETDDEAISSISASEDEAEPIATVGGTTSMAPTSNMPDESMAEIGDE